MIAKRAVRKQQNTSRPDGTKPGPETTRTELSLLALLSPAAEAFNVAVSGCIEDAAPEAVHALRTGSRRVQALLEAALRDPAPQTAGLRRPVEGWLRQLKQARRAAGQVRDLDVHRNLLLAWLGKQAAETGSGPLHGQADAFDLWLKEQRRRLARGMQKQLRKRQPRLLQCQAELFGAIVASSSPIGLASRSSESMALENFVRAAEEMPVLHAENLHDFRKVTKKARYLAEAGADDKSYVARALKRVQDAIGEWHDWVCLATEARRALQSKPSDDPSPFTVPLEREVNQYFSAAILTTQTIRGRLCGEWLAAQGIPSAPKRPASSAGIATRQMQTGQPA